MNTLYDLSRAARISLFPLRVIPAGSNSYVVVRVGGKTQFATRRLGAEATRLLRSGKSVAEARQILAASEHCDVASINLEPVIRRLINAGIVRRIDGQRIPSPKVTLREWFRFHMRLTLLPRYERAVRRLPLRWAHSLLTMSHRYTLRVAFEKKSQAAGRNFQRYIQDGSDEARRAFERAWAGHMIRNVVDGEALKGRDFNEINSWLDGTVRMTGRENLDAAIARGRGVLLVTYRFGSNRLPPIVLMRLGYSLLSTVSVRSGSEQMHDFVGKWQSSCRSNGVLELVDKFASHNLKKMIDRLRSGGIVMTVADVFDLPADTESELIERMRYFGVVRPDCPSARYPVLFLGRTIEINRWIAWLARRARPVIVPTWITRNGASMTCEVGQAFDIPDESSRSNEDYMREVTRSVFNRLSQLVSGRPEQWAGWCSVHKLERETSVT
jgi:lauroyl/myristoyl acyltransferase